jgi:hypothetical protein
MIALSILGHECLAERWEPEARLLDRTRWLFGRRRIEGSFPGWEVFFGPLHFMACRLPKKCAGQLVE